MDFVFYLADDSYLHLEFQSSQGPKELERFMEYDVALYRKSHKRFIPMWCTVQELLTLSKS